MFIMVRPRTVATQMKKQYRFKDKHRHDMTAKVGMQPWPKAKSSQSFTCALINLYIVNDTPN